MMSYWQESKFLTAIPPTFTSNKIPKGITFGATLLQMGHTGSCSSLEKGKWL